MQNIPLDGLVEIVNAAGVAMLKIYESDFEVESKADESPLTQADLAAHKIIEAGLTQLTPDIPIISEESTPPDYEVRKQWSTYWLVDPLDGTKEFVNRNGEFTVNIALIENNEASFGIVGVPVQDKIYIGDVEKSEAVLIENGGAPVKIGGNKMDGKFDHITIVASRSHGGVRLQAFLDSLCGQFKSADRTAVGSSLKLCVLAEGEADCYPRLGLTSEWDIAAAHAVLKAAGGEVYTFDKSPLRYNEKESFLNPDFVAVADADYNWWTVLPPLPPLEPGA